MPDPALDTSNKFRVYSTAVTRGSTGIAILHGAVGVMSPEDALVLAGWLVALADPEGTRFDEILKRIKET